MTAIDTLLSNSSLAAEAFSPDTGRQEDVSLSSLPTINMAHLVDMREDGCSRCQWTGDPDKIFKRFFYLPLAGEEFGFGSDGQKPPFKCVFCETMRCLLLVAARREGKVVTKWGTVRSEGGQGFEIDVDLDGSSTFFGIFIPSDIPRSSIELFGISRRHISQDSQLSQASSEWAQRRIAECVHAHQPCESQRDVSFLPTRLVNLQPYARGPDLRLDHQGSIPPGSRYIALSYCWGDYQPTCMTTAETLEQHLTSIPWHTLPRTFQDAAKFALSLGVKYLWIDSMCIIQGDQEDWQREAGKMYAIYKNSYITFAALFGHDPTSGLRTTSMRQTSTPFAQLLDYPMTYTLYARRTHYLGSKHRDDLDTEVRLRYPLLGRAWTYQERIIPPRVMFFSEDEIVYQCLNDISCECGATVEGDHEYMTSLSKTDIFLKTRKHSSTVVQDCQAAKEHQSIEPYHPFKVNRSSFGFIKEAFGPAGRMWRKVWGRRATRIGAVRSAPVDAQHDKGQYRVVKSPVQSLGSKRSGVSAPSDHSLDVSNTWRDKVVAEYSQLRITKQTDRLPALAAIAEQFQLVRQGEDYLAGLWSGSLHWDLLWSVAPCSDQTEQSLKGEGVESSKRSASFPTWSWASLQHRRGRYLPGFATDTSVPKATVVEAWCKYAEDNAFGVLESSKLVLRGTILHCRLEWVRTLRSYDTQGFWECKFHNGNSWAEFSDVYHGFHHILMDEENSDGTTNKDLSQEVYILHVLSGDDLQTGSLIWYFLVLRRDCQQDHIYTRAGYFTWEFPQLLFGNEVSNPRETLPSKEFMESFQKHSILATCEIR